MDSAGQPGIERVASVWSFAETVTRLDSLARARALTIFATIDFSGEAAKAGLQMANAGADLRQSQGRHAGDGGCANLCRGPDAENCDFYQDSNGKVWLIYNAPEYLAERHGIPAELGKNMSGIRALAEAAGAP
jgi:hypothetical protein